MPPDGRRDNWQFLALYGGWRYTEFILHITLQLSVDKKRGKMGIERKLN